MEEVQMIDCSSDVRKSILVVDDDRKVRAVLRAILEEQGYQVVEAADGDAACELVLRHRTDLVIMDLFMPGAEGIESIQKINYFIPGIKIIAMSGAPESVHLHTALALGAAKALRKPFSCESVMRLVRSLLDQPVSLSPQKQ